MFRRILVVIPLLLGTKTLLSEVSVSENEAPPALVTVPIEFDQKVFFVGTMGTARAYFDSPVREPANWELDSDSFTVLEVDVVEDSDREDSWSEAIIRFVPKRAGLATLPSIALIGDQGTFRTEVKQFLVSKPSRSDAMTLSIEPVKRSVYVMEPLRIDLRWECMIDAVKLREMKLLSGIFADRSIQFVIPRNTFPEEEQVGLPIGGRRAIARRILNREDKDLLGTITLPFYVQFSEPGRVTLPQTMIEVAVLDQALGGFGQYAAHFNNGLFEAVDTNEIYQKIYAVAPAIEIDVLPLPVDKLETSFTGLFDPIQIDVDLSPTDSEIGQLMELEIKVTGEAPREMVDLPKLNQHPALKNLFLVDDSFDRFWSEQGTVFRTRIRALDSSIESFPPLSFPVFDPVSGSFSIRTTDPIPLQLQPSGGLDLIDLGYQGDDLAVASEAAVGILGNLSADSTTRFLNGMFNLFRSGFWALLLLGPILFVALFPFARERYRRAIDPVYRARAEAYRTFRKSVPNSKAKWQAFLGYLAVVSGGEGDAWTRRDSVAALEKLGAEPSDIEKVESLHEAADARLFSSHAVEVSFDDLDPLFKRILRLAARVFGIVVAVLSTYPGLLEAGEWEIAERRFSEASEAVPESDLAQNLYAESALRFEAAARAQFWSGESWYNSGNAWFEAGNLGRSVAAYRNAQFFKPFNEKVAHNLESVRALVSDQGSFHVDWWERLPVPILRVLVVVANLTFWSLLFLLFRYRTRLFYIAVVTSATALVAISALFVLSKVAGGRSGVLVVESIEARKGPDHSYPRAFNEPIQDGLELRILERREDWIFVELPGGRKCWMPSSQIQVVGKDVS